MPSRYATRHDLEALEKRFMSVLSDKLAGLATVVGQVTTDITEVQTEMAALKAKVDAGIATPDDLSALATLTGNLGDLHKTLTAMLTATPAAS